MRISTRCQHVILALIDIAYNGPVTITRIAERQKVAVSYLEFVIARPRMCGMIVSSRGSDGSYKLSLTSDQININDIVYAVEGAKPRRTANDPRSSTDYRLLNILRQVADDKADGLVTNVTLRDICSSKLQSSASTILDAIRNNFSISDGLNTQPIGGPDILIPLSPDNNNAENIKFISYGSIHKRTT